MSCVAQPCTVAVHRDRFDENPLRLGGAIIRLVLYLVDFAVFQNTRSLPFCCCPESLLEHNGLVLGRTRQVPIPHLFHETTLFQISPRFTATFIRS